MLLRCLLDMTRIVAIGGIKGGSSKTTLTVNLATAWAQARRSVLVVDADQQRWAATWLKSDHAGSGGRGDGPDRRLHWGPERNKPLTRLPA
jgi:cellulose biosynthesis protein BcsQ